MGRVSLQEDASAQIYLDYHDKVSSYVRGKIQDHHEAEDIVSSVFVKVYQKLESFDPVKASLSTWVYAITRNTVVDYYRTRRGGRRLLRAAPPQNGRAG